METLPRQPAEEKQGRPQECMKIPVGILCCRHWRIPYVWTSFCSTRGGRRRPSTQSPPLFGGTAIQVKIINIRSSRSSIQKLMNFESKNQTKWPIELCTLKQELETDDDDATIRERFSLVQSILFIDITDIPPAHFQERMVEMLWGNYAIWFGSFDNGL